MTTSSTALPTGYHLAHEINLAQNKGLSILLNVLAVALLFLTLALLAAFTCWVRPGLPCSGLFQVSLSSIAGLLGLLVLIAVNLVIHELIHGVFFWAFTGSRPVFALHLAYAYAAAPTWYIPRRHYWLIGLAPLAIIDLVGLIVLMAAPPVWVLPVLFIIAFNTSGSIGDVLILARLFRSPAACMVNDQGDKVLFYTPGVPEKDIP